MSDTTKIEEEDWNLRYKQLMIDCLDRIHFGLEKHNEMMCNINNKLDYIEQAINKHNE